MLLKIFQNFFGTMESRYGCLKNKFENLWARVWGDLKSLEEKSMLKDIYKFFCNMCSHLDNFFCLFVCLFCIFLTGKTLNLPERCNGFQDARPDTASITNKRLHNKSSGVELACLHAVQSFHQLKTFVPTRKKKHNKTTKEY